MLASYKEQTEIQRRQQSNRSLIFVRTINTPGTCVKEEEEEKKKILTIINPRLTKRCFVTRLTRGVHPPMNLKNKRLRYAYLVQWYSYGSPLSIHTTKVQTSHVLPICEIWAKIELFAKKFSSIGISPDFLLIKEGNDIFNIYCTIQDQTMSVFFKIVIF